MIVGSGWKGLRNKVYLIKNGVIKDAFEIGTMNITSNSMVYDSSIGAVRTKSAFYDRDSGMKSNTLPSGTLSKYFTLYLRVGVRNPTGSQSGDYFPISQFGIALNNNPSRNTDPNSNTFYSREMAGEIVLLKYDLRNLPDMSGYSIFARFTYVGNQYIGCIYDIWLE